VIAVSDNTDEPLPIGAIDDAVNLNVVLIFTGRGNGGEIRESRLLGITPPDDCANATNECRITRAASVFKEGFSIALIKFGIKGR
jgi:hypothetical protein